MKNEIILDRSAFATFKRIQKKTPKEFIKISNFIFKKLVYSENPLKLPNVKKLVSFNDNRYRWRLGDHRIIANVNKDEIYIIKIIKISKRNEDTYK